MSIKSEFKKVLRIFDIKNKKQNIVGTQMNINETVPTDIDFGEYKRNVWKPHGAVEEYHKNVEHNFFNAVTSKFFTQYLKSGDKVLDVGAGTGRLSFIIADKGCSVTALDISEYMLEKLNETKAERDITTILADGDKLPVKDANYDAVVSMDFMLHFLNWQDFLKEKARACKSGGYIIYNFYNTDNLKNVSADKIKASNYVVNGGIISHCSKEELQGICNKLGLEIVKIQPYNFLGPNALWYPNLSIDEVNILRAIYYKTLANEKVLGVIKEFEEKIVENLSPDYCANIIIILRKK